MDSKIKIWIHSTRPKTLPAAISPVLMGLAMAYADILQGKYPYSSTNILFALVTLFCAVLIQIGTNFANDYFDFVKGTDNVKRVGPLRATQAGLVTAKEMKAAFIITFGLAAGLGIILVIRGGIPVLVIGIISIFFGIIYTAGPKPLAYIGLGELFVLIFFGPVAVSGTYYLQTLHFSPVTVAAGVSAGLFSTAVLTANNLRDIDTDRQSGRKNLMILFGYNFGVGEYYFCVIMALLVPVIITIATRSAYFSLISLLAVLIEIRSLKTLTSRPRPKPEELIKVLSDTGKALLIFSILFSAGWIISAVLRK